MDTALSTSLDAIDAGSAFVRRTSADLLRLHGGDGLDLLHRIAASEIRSLAPGAPRRLVFTDDKGRAVDAPLAWIDDDLCLLASPGRGPVLRAWIDRWIIMEDARIELDESSVVFDLLGYRAVDAARQYAGGAQVVPTGPDPAGRDLPTRAQVVIDLARATPLHDHLAHAITATDDAAIAAWCARAGVARPGPGLDAGCHPLELGWRDWISFTKGCYIGQEVVARLDTYDKVRRHPVAIRCAAPPMPGAIVRHAGRKVGVVFESASFHDHARAVAVIERGVEVGADLEVENAGAGTLVRIPAP